MASLGIDGLASGLDTTAIINQLMQLEAGPQTLLKSKQSSAQNVVTALQGINSRLASLTESATKAAKPENWKTFAATSSLSSVTATAGTDALSGTISFSVDRVATRQVSLSAAVADGPALVASNPPTLSVKKADGSIVSVTAASNSLEDIAGALNDADAGVSVTAVRVTSGATPTYRLQFTATDSGTAGAFEVYVGDEAAVNAATATRIDTASATTPVDAQITLWKGSAYEQVFTQSSNTFTGLMSGVDVTVSKETAVGETATITVKPDATKVQDLAKELVASISTVLLDIQSRTATTTTTGSDGTTKVTGGLLTGDVSTQQLASALTEAVSYPVNDKSPSSVGFVLGKDGNVTFDAEKFAQALKDDPDGTAAFVQAIAARVKDVSTGYSDPYEGMLTQRITGQQSLIKDYTTQIEDWDRRLEMRRSGLQAQYAALETAMSNMKSQSNWLASQLASLSTSS